MKHARRKPSDKAQREVDSSFEVLKDEKLDAETIMRHAERSGLQTQALRDAGTFHSRDGRFSQQNKTEISENRDRRISQKSVTILREQL